MQTPVQRSAEIRSGEGGSQRPDVMHQQMSDMIRKDDRQIRQQVRQSNKGEKGLIDKDGRDSQEKDRRKREKEKTQAALSELVEERRLLDIRI
jgi:hypothetical protein